MPLMRSGAMQKGNDESLSCLWGFQCVFRQTAKRLDVSTMFNLMLDQVMKHPFWSDIVIGKSTRATKLLERHPAKGSEKMSAQGIEAPQVLIQGDIANHTQNVLFISIFDRKQLFQLFRPGCVFQSFDVEPIEFNQSDMVEQDSCDSGIRSTPSDSADSAAHSGLQRSWYTHQRSYAFLGYGCPLGADPPACLSAEAAGGHPVSASRLMVERMLWVAHTDSSWRGLPERFSPWATVASRNQQWSRRGPWTRIAQVLFPAHTSSS